MCQSMVNIQSPTAEIRRGKKRQKKKEEERNYRMKILWSALLHRATITRPLRRDHINQFAMTSLVTLRTCLVF